MDSDGRIREENGVSGARLASHAAKKSGISSIKCPIMLSRMLEGGSGQVLSRLYRIYLGGIRKETIDFS